MVKTKRMDKLEYIPGDLVMTNGVPLGTAQNVVYRVTSSDPSKTLELDDGTVLKGVVCLENIEGAEFGDKGYLSGDCCAWVKDIVPKNRGMYSRWDEKQGKFAVTQGEDSLENYMPSCRACNFRKRDMTLEQFRAEIKRQAVGLLSGAAKFQVKMSIVYGLIIPQFDKKVVFYFEKVKRKD